MPHVDPEARRAYHRAYRVRWDAEHRDSIIESKRRYRAANPERIREQNARHRAKRAESTHVLYFHGLQPGEHDALYAAQNGRCAICDRSAPLRGPGCLHIDHDHATGVRRGLICHPCNTALRVVDEVGPTWALRALAYLSDPPLQRMRTRRDRTA